MMYACRHHLSLLGAFVLSIAYLAHALPPSSPDSLHSMPGAIGPNANYKHEIPSVLYPRKTADLPPEPEPEPEPELDEGIVSGLSIEPYPETTDYVLPDFDIAPGQRYQLLVTSNQTITGIEVVINIGSPTETRSGYWDGDGAGIRDQGVGIADLWFTTPFSGTAIFVIQYFEFHAQGLAEVHAEAFAENLMNPQFNMGPEQD